MPTLTPIPCASAAERVEKNNKVVEIMDQEMPQIDALLADFTPSGERYHGTVETNTSVYLSKTAVAHGWSLDSVGHHNLIG